MSFKSKFFNGSVLVVSKIFWIGKKMDNRFFRLCRFKAMSSKQKFTFSSQKCDGGTEHYILFPYDQAISRRVYVDGHFGWSNFLKVKDILAENTGFEFKTLIDVGANIGSICIPAVKRGFAERAVVFEPEINNYNVLMANVHLNELASKIVVHNMALGAENALLDFELSDKNSGDHRIRVTDQNGLYNESRRSKVTVPCRTLDTVIPEIDQQTCLLWLDTQGYEGKVLQGAGKLIEQRVPLVVEFWPYGLARANNYQEFKEALLCYAHFYDLEEDIPKVKQVTNESIDNLYDKFIDTRKDTDLLLL